MSNESKNVISLKDNLSKSGSVSKTADKRINKSDVYKNFIDKESHLVDGVISAVDLHTGKIVKGDIIAAGDNSIIVRKKPDPIPDDLVKTFPGFDSKDDFYDYVNSSEYNNFIDKENHLTDGAIVAVDMLTGEPTEEDIISAGEYQRFIDNERDLGGHNDDTLLLGDDLTFSSSRSNDLSEKLTGVDSFKKPSDFDSYDDYKDYIKMIERQGFIDKEKNFPVMQEGSIFEDSDQSLSADSVNSGSGSVVATKTSGSGSRRFGIDEKEIYNNFIEHEKNLFVGKITEFKADVASWLDGSKGYAIVNDDSSPVQKDVTNVIAAFIDVKKP